MGSYIKCNHCQKVAVGQTYCEKCWNDLSEEFTRRGNEQLEDLRRLAGIFYVMGDKLLEFICILEQRIADSGGWKPKETKEEP